MTTDSPPSGPFRARAAVIETDLGGEVILLDPETQEMYSLGETGRAVWNALPAADIRALVEVLCDAFDVSAERAGEDVCALLSDLVEAGLVVAGDGEVAED